MSSLESYRSLLNKAILNRDVASANLGSTVAKLGLADRNLSLSKEGLAFFTKAANRAQEQVSGVIATVVTTALHIVHGEEYEFRVKFVTRRNSTEADLILVKNGHEVDPLGNSGLGVANIIAIALRAAFIIMEGKRDKFLALDEPTAALKVGKQALAGEMLQSLCQKLGFQILLTTHSPELAEYGDKIYCVSMDGNGISSTREITDKAEIRELLEA